MAGLSLRDAAREAGVSKSTIFRAIKSGRLSAARDDDGNFSIEPSELFRVYPPRNAQERAAAVPPGQDAMAFEAPETPLLKVEIEGLKAQLALMRDQLDDARLRADDLKADRDAWRGQAEAMRLLADQRPRRGLFGWLKAG